MSSDQSTLGSGTREYGEHQQHRHEIRAQRRRRIRAEESLKEANVALVDGAYAKAGVIARDYLLPLLDVQHSHLHDYDDVLAGSKLAWDWDAICRFHASPDRFIHATMQDSQGFEESRRRQQLRLQGQTAPADIARETIEHAVKSLESVAVAQDLIPGELSQSSRVHGHSLELGIQWQSFDYRTPDEVGVVNPDIHPAFHVSIGDPGNGKSTSLDTLVEDAYHDGQKIIDLTDFDELENAMYDVPSQNAELQGIRDDLGLPETWGDHPEYERPELEILHPLTRGFVGADLPYNTDDGAFTARPFVVPAASLDHSSLKAMMPHLTETQENYLTEALESLADEEDWDLGDLDDAVKDTQANKGVKRRLHAAIKTLDDRGFIATHDHEHAIDWEAIFHDTETITAFSCSLMEQELHKLMVVSYLLDAIYEERQPATPDAGDGVEATTQYPRAMIVMREMQDVAPGGRKTKGGDGSKSRIQTKLVSRMQTIGEKRRHVNMGLLGDTQKWLQINAGVRENIDRVMSFKNSPGAVRSVFDEVTGSTQKRHASKVQHFDRGECVVVGSEWLSTNQSFVMPVQWAPPMCHHLDSETEPAGWYARVDYLDEETLRENPFELPEATVNDADMPESDGTADTPEGFEEFVAECVTVNEDDPDERLAKEDARTAYKGWADKHGFEMYNRAGQFGGWFRSFFSKDLCPDCKTKEGRDGRRKAYKYAALTRTGQRLKDRAAAGTGGDGGG